MLSRKNEPCISEAQATGYLRTLKQWRWPCVIIDPRGGIIIHDYVTGADIKRLPNMAEFQLEANRAIAASR